MANYDASTLAGQVFPIVGAGIGMSIIARTSRDVMDTMYGRRYRPQAQRRPVHYRRKTTSSKRKTIRYRPYPGVRPRYSWY